MSKPDFSGTWTFNPEKSRLQITAPDASLFVVDHRDPMLRISRTHYNHDKQDTFTLDLTTDGTDVIVERGDVRLRCHARWDGETLVFDTWMEQRGAEATNIVRYALSRDGKTLTADEQFRSHSLNYDNVWTLDRVL